MNQKANTSSQLAVNFHISFFHIFIKNMTGIQDNFPRVKSFIRTKYVSIDLYQNIDLERIKDSSVYRTLLSQQVDRYSTVGLTKMVFDELHVC